MSDLFGNRIVGFPTRRLKSLVYSIFAKTFSKNFHFGILKVYNYKSHMTFDTLSIALSHRI